MKLVTISWVRNEADILETFARHHCAFVDRMVIVLHRCLDNAEEILTSLQQEGLPLEFQCDNAVEHRQAQALTTLLHQVGHKHHPEWVLPLDADEFLVPEGVGDLPSILDVLPRDRVTLLPWRTYVPTPGDDQQELNILRRIQHRRNPEPSVHMKVLIPASLAHGLTCSLTLGNHALLRDRIPVSSEKTTLLHLAHFPVRSSSQLTAKVLAGWVSHCANPLRQPLENAHWWHLFETLRSGDDLSPKKLSAIAKQYGLLASHKTRLCCDPVKSSFPVSYRQEPARPLHVLTDIAGALALEHCASLSREKRLRKQEDLEEEWRETELLLRETELLLAEKERLSGELERECRELRDTLKYREQDITLLLASRSWKITAPLRAVLSSLLFLNKWFMSHTRPQRAKKPPLMKVSTLPPALPVSLPVPPPLRNLPPPISILVTARNYGHFLEECLTSIARQTMAPTEVIYYDDGSEDDSVARARSFAHVRVLSRPHEGVAAARNAAVEASTGSLLLHVDGDDLLPPTYLQDHLAALERDSEALFAYGSRRTFGAQEEVECPPEWDRDRLWIRNFVNTSSLLRRDAFLQSGGWREGIGTLWDWDLWLRISRLGPGVCSNAELQYRRHPHCWSTVFEKDWSDLRRGREWGEVRRRALRISICTVTQGRVKQLFPVWLDALARTLQEGREEWERPQLIILDNSTEGLEPFFRNTLRDLTHSFRNISIIPFPESFHWTSERERQNGVSRLLAKAYNRLLELTDDEVLWFIEDDVVVPPHSYAHLFTLLTNGLQPRPAVSGLYCNRHVPQFVAHTLDAFGHPVAVRSSDRLQLIDLAGTGCLMIFRPLARHRFESHWRGRVPAHDWTWCERLRAQGQHVILDSSVRCQHYVTETTFV